MAHLALDVDLVPSPFLTRHRGGEPAILLIHLISMKGTHQPKSVVTFLLAAFAVVNPRAIVAFS